jgi:molybdopterin converting factor subunit 1
MPRVRVKYYAVLRERAGCSDETLHTAAPDAAALYDILAARHGFDLPRVMLRVAVNAEFTSWDRPLRDGDEVVFLPPVAGG